MTAHLGTSVTRLTSKCNGRNLITPFITLHMFAVSKIGNHVTLRYQTEIKRVGRPSSD